VVVESPYAGSASRVVVHIEYARVAMRACLDNGEAPYASHLLYTRRVQGDSLLRDEDPWHRAIGLAAGAAWRDAADVAAFYVDLGFSRGMLAALEECQARGRRVEFRSVATLNGGRTSPRRSARAPPRPCRRARRAFDESTYPPT
jgi:hypothetical protein